jgi:hypothetical protein
VLAHAGEIKLGKNASLVRRFAKPFRGFLEIPRHALAGQIQDAEIFLVNGFSRVGPGADFYQINGRQGIFVRNGISGCFGFNRHYGQHTSAGREKQSRDQRYQWEFKLRFYVNRRP